MDKNLVYVQCMVVGLICQSHIGLICRVYKILSLWKDTTWSNLESKSTPHRLCKITTPKHMRNSFSHLQAVDTSKCRRYSFVKQMTWFIYEEPRQPKDHSKYHEHYPWVSSFRPSLITWLSTVNFPFEVPIHTNESGLNLRSYKGEKIESIKNF